MLTGCAGDIDQDRPTPALRFDRETVVLRVDVDTLEVEGWYRMLCAPAGMRNAPLFYPYPRDSLMGAARTVLVECRGVAGNWRPVVHFERPPMGIRWTVPLTVSDTLTVHTVYRQALHGSSARYIATTTRSWNRPLTEARFEIQLPDGYDPVTFSHDFVEHPAPRGRLFVYEKSEFWPDADISVTWTRNTSVR